MRRTGRKTIDGEMNRPRNKKSKSNEGREVDGH